jgi:hypothetical protein
VARVSARRADLDPSLERIRGGAPAANPNVRRLAGFASVHECPTAAVAFAARVDTNRALKGTPYQMPFGQSPFAIGRGYAFEKLLRQHGHAELRAVLREGTGFDFSTAAVHNLRDGFPLSTPGRTMRAQVTRDQLRQVVTHPDELAIVDGAILPREIGGVRVDFEADELAIGIEGAVLVGENKSWPVVDGRPADPDALGSALDQSATYVLLAREIVADEGLDPSLVSGDALLITPRNTGLSPVLHRQNVESRVSRIERLLEGVPQVGDITRSVPVDVTFERVADMNLEADARIDAFADLTDQVGRRYEAGSCLTSCGFAWACRACEFADAAPSLAGERAARAVPSIDRLDRVAQLGAGAPPTAGEAPVAQELARAGRLVDEVFVAPPRRRRSA